MTTNINNLEIRHCFFMRSMIKIMERSINKHLQQSKIKGNEAIAWILIIYIYIQCKRGVEYGHYSKHYTRNRN